MGQEEEARCPGARDCPGRESLSGILWFGPWFGLHTKQGRYESIGSATSPVSFTALDDVGRLVAQLAAKPLDQIPEKVHIGGDTRSIAEVAQVMERAGSGKIAVSEVDLDKYKAETTKDTPSTDPARFLRFLMGERK